MMPHVCPRYICLVLALLCASVAFQPSAHAQGRSRCFSELGSTTCIAGRFLAYWEQNGGVAVFGYPVSPARDERNRDTGQTHLTQWFQRNRFELHLENPAPYDVLVGRLGEDRLRQLGRDWHAEPRETGPKDGCRWFEQTGHNVCNQQADRGFRQFWESHGLHDPRLDPESRSVALFGLPLTSPTVETNASGNTVVTQWFERARFEWHPENPPAFQVLLGLLGSEVHSNAMAPTLHYLWPRTVPPGFHVQRDTSSATDDAFTLTLATTPQGGPPVLASIGGGRGHEVPDVPGYQPITVRGQSGKTYTTGDGFSVHWVEDGHPYMVKHGPGVSEVVALAEQLEPLDLATWQQRLAHSK